MLSHCKGKNLKLLTLPYWVDDKTLVQVESLTELEHFGIDNCQNVSNIGFLRNLKKLKSLNLKKCGDWDLSPIRSLTALEELALSGPDTNKSLFHSNCGGNLEYSSDSHLAVLGTLNKLKSLSLVEIMLVDLSFLSTFSELEKLELVECKSIFDLASIGHLTHLRHLNLKGNSEIRNLPALAHLVNLETLNFNRCNISDLSSIRNLINLRELHLGRSKVTDLSALNQLCHLEHLSLIHCDKINDITPLSNNKRLKFLSLRGCAGTTTGFSALNQLTNIETLDLRGVHNLNTLDFVYHMPRIHTLRFGGHKINNKELKKLSAQKTLKHLSISSSRGNECITDISALSSLNELQTLYLNLNNFVNLTPLKSLYKLRKVGLRSFTETLESFPELRQMEEISLNSIHVYSCYGDDTPLKDLSCYSHLKNLKRFRFSLQDIQINSMSTLANIPKLKTAEVSLINRHSLQPLILLTNLENITCYYLNDIDDFSYLSNLTALKKITLFNCNKLSDFSFLSNLTQLHTLILYISRPQKKTLLESIKKFRDVPIIKIKVFDADKYDYYRTQKW